MSDFAPQLAALSRHLDSLRDQPVALAALDAAEQQTVELLGLCLETLARSDRVDPYTVRDIRLHLTRLPTSLPWVKEMRSAFGADAIDLHAPLAHDVEVGRRVVSAHRFLEGRPQREFGDVAVRGSADIRVGQGLSLADGTLQHFLTAMARHTGYADPILALQPWFDVEAEALAAAIEEGHDAVGHFLQAQLIQRFDPARRRLVGTLPDVWLGRFSRLAGSVEARRLQLELAAGARLTDARQRAASMGMDSLRGLAFTFDVAPLVRGLQRRYGLPLQAGDEASGGDDADRMVSMADQILARLERPMARRAEVRLRSLIDGAGTVEARRYDEREHLGEGADGEPWRFFRGRDLPALKKAGDASPVPVPGRTYVVQPGDHLGRIARLAYRGRADFRVLLEHNPHIEPSQLVEGQRILVPEWPPKRRAPAVEMVTTETPRVAVDGASLKLPGRTVGPLAERDGDALLAIAERVAQLSADELGSARATRLPDGWAVLAGGRLLVEPGDADLPLARSLFPDAAEPLSALADHFAAQLRGDVVLQPGHAVPIGHREGDPHRRLWLRAALRRALTMPDALRLRPVGDAVALLGSSGETVATLHPEDLDAVARAPGLRLRGLVGARDPLAMRSLATLWLARLLGTETEILVAPLTAHARRAARVEHASDGCRYLVPMGTPVFAVARGEVEDVDRHARHGATVRLRHVAGIWSELTGLGATAVRRGERVDADTMLGRTGIDPSDRTPAVRLTMGVGDQRWSGAHILRHLGTPIGDPSPTERWVAPAANEDDDAAG